jgi:hypothetical protein
MYNDGKNVAAIADYLNQEGFKRKQFGSVQYRHIRENRWTHKTIVAMLKNFAYIAKREVNSKNKNEVQAHLKAWQQYQIVPASWAAIIDEDLFFKVQKRLETTRLTERTRVENGENRVFFISGLIKCECCGRALVGHSAHGKNKVHRYYEHKRVKGEKLSCPVTRYPANEIEDAILKHLDKVLEDSGYLDQIESNIKQCMGLSKAADKSKKATLEKSIQKIEVEIENVFKLTMTMKSGSAGSDLIHEKLQKLAEKKKANAPAPKPANKPMEQVEIDKAAKMAAAQKMAMAEMAAKQKSNMPAPMPVSKPANKPMEQVEIDKAKKMASTPQTYMPQANTVPDAKMAAAQKMAEQKMAMAEMAAKQKSNMPAPMPRPNMPTPGMANPKQQPVATKTPFKFDATDPVPPSRPMSSASPNPMMMRRGGSVKNKPEAKFSSGGSVSKASSRGDGIAQRGKTKGRMC